MKTTSKSGSDSEQDQQNAFGGISPPMVSNVSRENRSLKSVKLHHGRLLFGG